MIDDEDLEEYDVEVNDGTQDVQEEEAYEMHLSDMRCPCCGKKFRLVDTVQELDDTSLPLTTESTLLKENALSEYLLDICAKEAMDIYDEEIQSYEPEVDHTGRITPEYNQRFKYCHPSLKNVIKVKANAISNKLAQDGIQVAPYYIENEIFEYLKHTN